MVVGITGRGWMILVLGSKASHPKSFHNGNSPQLKKLFLWSVISILGTVKHYFVQTHVSWAGNSWSDISKLRLSFQFNQKALYFTHFWSVPAIDTHIADRYSSSLFQVFSSIVLYKNTIHPSRQINRRRVHITLLDKTNYFSITTSLCMSHFPDVRNFTSSFFIVSALLVLDSSFLFLTFSTVTAPINSTALDLSAISLHYKT